MAAGSNLRNRVLTAACLIPLAIAAIFCLSTTALAWLFGAVVVLGAVEWAKMAGFQTPGARYAYAVTLGAILFACYPLSRHWPWLLWAGLAWWAAALFLVVATPWGRGPSAADGAGRLLKSVVGGLILVPTWAALLLVQRRAHGAYELLWLMMLVWGADSAAFFAGRRWGKHRLAPSISPGKTWEGLAGALAATLCGALVAAAAAHMGARDAVSFVLLSVLTVMASVLGDLVESLFKRQAGLKDSGNLLPGHGGILDRIDSLTAAAPVFALGLVVLEVAI